MLCLQKRRTSPALAASTILTVFCTAAPASAYCDLVAYGVALYGSAPRCPANGLTYPDDDAVAVRNSFRDALGFPSSSLKVYTNGDVWGWDLADASKTSGWGKDNIECSGSDGARFFFYSGHGSRNCDTGSNSNFSLVMGHNTDNVCQPNSTSHMLFGNGGFGSAENVILASCLSGQYCMWQNGGYWQMDGARLNVVNGFHGLSYDNSDNNWRYYLYVGNSATSGQGDNWVDILTDFRVGDDQCATSVTFGTNSARNSEVFYDFGFADWAGTSAHNLSSYHYICGCDPDEGPKLPDC